MRLEHIPVVLGLFFAIVGFALIADAILREEPLMISDRRKRERPARHRGGEAAIGIGVVGVAAALIGTDQWRFGTLSILGGVIALAIGVWLNWEYVKDFMLGPESRIEEGEEFERPMRHRAHAPSDREVPTPAIPGDLVTGSPSDLHPRPPRTSVPPGETRRLRIR
jgi:hypothetical protein